MSIRHLPTIEYKCNPEWMTSLLALLKSGPVVVDCAQRETLRKRLYRHGVFGAIVTTNPGRGVVVKLR